MQKRSKFPGRAAASFAILAALSLLVSSAALAQYTGDLAFGGAASARSATTAFDNPAGLVLFDEHEYLVGSLNVQTNITYTGETARYIGPQISGRSDSSTIESGPVIFHARPLKGRWHLGWGIFQPLGGRNLGYDKILPVTRERWTAYQFGPAFGYRVTDKFSVGASLNVQFADFWCNMLLPELRPDGTFSQGLVGFLTTNADSWAVGYRIGLMHQFTPGTRIGLTYSSKIEHYLKGYSTYISDTIPGIRSDDYRLYFPVPPSWMLSLHHDINERWAVVGSVDYVLWEPYWPDTLLEGLVSPAPFNQLGGRFDMQNRWAYQVGAEVKLNEKWGLTFGYREEEGFTVDEFRSWKDYGNGMSAMGFVASRALTDTVRMDFGYRYIDGKDAPIDTAVRGVQGDAFGEVGVLTWDQHIAGVALTVTPKRFGGSS